MTITHDAAKQFTTLRDLIADTAADLSAANPCWTAGCLADALIRTGQLVLVDDGAVERVARAIKAKWDAAMHAEAEQSDGAMGYKEGPWEEWQGEAEAALAALQVKP